ncbi:transporter [Cupriavidus necator]|uniref:SphA family protein n=1 Tax=Cupriavidus necator TaxID=106590 RepID=UPI00339D32F9
MSTKTARRLVSALALLCAPAGAYATEGALGRPVTGTSVMPHAGVVAPEPILAVNIGELYLDGSISGSRTVPVAGKASLGIDGKVAFTLATVMKVWDTGPGAWNFASSFTLPYVWTRVTANVSAGAFSRSSQDTASNLFDIYFTPAIAGYHFSKTEHVALSLNIWAPTGKYDPNALANPSLNNWTFVPQVAYTKMFPEYGLEFDAVAGLQFYTRNSATDYQNAPLFTLDTMLLKRFANGAGVGLIAGTTQQLGDDSGPLADRLNGFRGHDWAVGPIVTYDTKIGAKSLLSLSLRWVPTVAGKNRLKSTSTVMGTAAIVF